MTPSMGESQASATVAPTPDYVLPFAALDRNALAVAGGKAANLGELQRAGLPVPPGFCVTTAAYTLATAGDLLQPVLDALAITPAEDNARLNELAGQARSLLLGAAMLPEVAA